MRLFGFFSRDTRSSIHQIELHKQILRTGFRNVGCISLRIGTHTTPRCYRPTIRVSRRFMEDCSSQATEKETTSTPALCGTGNFVRGFQGAIASLRTSLAMEAGKQWLVISSE